MKTINSAKRWVAIIALSMLNPACTHETKSAAPVNQHATGHKKSLPVHREAFL